MFISYAQNFEDVLLHRALNGIQNGFYIDVGAQDPVVDSVSMGFYRLGWRGVHVEPVATYAEALRKERPDETVIEAAVGEPTGDIAFYEIVGTGLSTADAAAASRHVANGFRSEVRSVIGIRLSEILDTYRDRDIHWLKIDVEGQEISAVRSWLPSEVRPWIVVVESVDPFSFEDNSVPWEPELLALGYTFAHFDGLNRFYVSKAHPELMGSFGVGPNLFDDFSLSGTSSSPFCNAVKSQLEASEGEREARLRKQIEKHHGEIARLQLGMLEQVSERDALAREVEVLRASVLDFLQSRSWRLTAPVRGASRAARRATSLPLRILRALPRRLVPFLRYRAPRIYGLLAGSSVLRAVYTRFLRPGPAVSSAPRAVERSSFQGRPRVSSPRVTAFETQFGDNTASALKRATNVWRRGKRIDV